MTTKEKLEKIVAAADELKAEQIETLDVGGKTSITDFFVVCTGTSDRHASSIADKIRERLLEEKEKPLRVEGENTGWVLLDFGDVVVHVMRDEQRQFYDIESLWKEMSLNPDVIRRDA
ncbi:MAG: ribosome silencing factor [Armatimonadetes bacterium]|nr:ribosome silencing factor [Armatimonadota bacterium]